MNPFKALNIEPTDDKKVIKKAYAVLIKQYKPDEHPEKFKEIQAAYKMALSMGQWHEQKQQDNNQSNLGECKPETSNFELSDAVVEEQQEYAEQQALIDNLFKQLHQVAFAPLQVKSKLESWKFIEDYYKIDDLTLKPQVARKVFKKVAEYNVFQMRVNKTLLIHPKVLLMLNEVFNWGALWEDYQILFPDIYFEVTFHYFENQYIENYDRSLIDSKSFLYKRLISLLIDVFFGFIYTLIFIVLTYYLIDYQNIESIYFELLFIVIFIISSFMVEFFSQEKATLGKSILSLIVTDDYGNNATKRDVFERHIFSNLLLVPFFYLPIIGLFSSTLNYMFLSFCFAVFIFFIFKKKSLPQDYLTSTYVLLKERKKSHYFDYEFDESARSG